HQMNRNSRPLWNRLASLRSFAYTDLLMPIEFNCRICNAMIRVPDKSAGGKGRCPKCGVRITVPRKSTPKPEPQAAEPQEEFEFPGVAADVIAGDDSAASSA